jgi:hypothetical protein
MPYNTKADAVSALLPGYRVVGEAPYIVKVANPDAGKAGEPAQIDQTQGIILSVQGPGGEPDEVVVKEVGNNPNTKGGVGYDVIKGPTKAPTKAATPAQGLERLDANLQPITDPNKPAVYVRDPKAPPGTAPFKVEEAAKLGDPNTWTPIYRTPGDPTSGIVGQYDPKTQTVAASVSAAPNAKPSGVFTNVIDPNDPAKKRVIGLVDTGDQSLHPVATQADGKQVITTATGIYSYDKDTDKVSLLTTIDPHSPIQIVTYPDGSIYSFNPNEPDPTKQLSKLQGQKPPQTITSNGTTYTLKADGSGYELPPGVSRPTTVDNTTTLKRIVIRDDQGNVLSDTPNVNYVAPAATVPAANTTAPYIQVQDPNDPSKLIWVENKGRVTASQALKDLASHLSGQVVSGDITVDEAKSIIDASNAKMTNDINALNAARGAAGDVLTNAQANATTGASLLNQRVSSATGALNSLISSAAGSKMTSIPAGVGQGLVQGLTDWTAQLGGGQGVYDAAARMVQASDPKISGDPTLAQQAQQALAQMFTQWQQQTGAPHPLVAATEAAKASQASNGLVAPNTTGQTTASVQAQLAAQQAAAAQAAGTAGQLSTAALNARGLMDNPQGRAVAAGQVPVAAGGAPTTPGLYNPAYQQAFVSPIGLPATGYVVGGSQVPTLPIPGYSPYGPFQAPVTV